MKRKIEGVEYYSGMDGMDTDAMESLEGMDQTIQAPQANSDMALHTNYLSVPTLPEPSGINNGQYLKDQPELNVDGHAIGKEESLDSNWFNPQSRNQEHNEEPMGDYHQHQQQNHYQGPHDNYPEQPDPYSGPPGDPTHFSQEQETPRTDPFEEPPRDNTYQEAHPGDGQFNEEPRENQHYQDPEDNQFTEGHREAQYAESQERHFPAQTQDAPHYPEDTSHFVEQPHENSYPEEQRAAYEEVEQPQANHSHYSEHENYQQHRQDSYQEEKNYQAQPMDAQYQEQPASYPPYPAEQTFEGEAHAEPTPPEEHPEMKVQTEQGNGQSFEATETNEGEPQARNMSHDKEHDNTKSEEMEIVQKTKDPVEKEKEKAENDDKKTEEEEHIQENEHSSEDPNDDFCKFCNATGDLLCCEKCPTSWHLYCLQPPLKDFPEGDWSCPLCEKKELGPPITLSKVELRITRELHRPNRQRRKSTEAQTEERFAVPPGPWWDCISLISTLKKHKSAWPFLDPVDPVRLKILEYYQVVPRPMDLGTVEKKLRDEKYRNIHQFANDVRLIWSNAETFNGPDHNVTKLAYEVREVFEKLFQEKLRYWSDYIDKMPLTRRRKKPTFVPKEPPKKPLKSEGSCSTDTGEDEVPAKSVKRESSSKVTKQKSKLSTSAITPNSKKSNSSTKAKNTPTKPPITKQRSTTQPQPIIQTYNIPNPTTYPRAHIPNPTSPLKGTTLPPISPHLNNPAHAVPVSPMYPKNFATRTLPTSPHSRSGSMVNGNYDGTGDVRMGVPIQYMRVHYEKKIVKADSTSLDSLKMRLKNCFDIQCNIRLYYLDEDKTRINVFDENCFNIFLQSKIPKDLYMEKE